MRSEAWLSHIFGAGFGCLPLLAALLYAPTAERLLRRKLASKF
jgi:hypothetical protein